MRVLLSALLLLSLACPGPRADSLLPLPASLGGLGGPHFRLTWFAGPPSMLGGGPAYLILDRRLYSGCCSRTSTAWAWGLTTAGRCPSRRCRATGGRS